jgi:hypothetical protein
MRLSSLIPHSVLLLLLGPKKFGYARFFRTGVLQIQLHFTQKEFASDSPFYRYLARQPRAFGLV